MKKVIILTTLIVSFAAHAAELEEYVPGKNYPVALREEPKPSSSWTVAKKPTEASKSDIAIGGQKDTTVATTGDDWTVIGTNKPKPEPAKKPEAPKSSGLISSPTMAGLTGSALDLTKNLLVGPSTKSDGGSKGSTWTGNVGFDIQNQGLDQTSLGNIGTDITNLGGGATQIQFAGGGNTAAQQVNKPKKK